MKIGRNAPCHCGSKIKYKHCHLAEDRKPIRWSRSDVVREGEPTRRQHNRAIFAIAAALIWGGGI